MKKINLFLLATVILSILFVPACSNNIPEEPIEKFYNINVDYIGNNSVDSENVANITEYKSIEEYTNAQKHNSILWIEDTIADFDAEKVRTFMDSCDRVIVISATSKESVVKQITGNALYANENRTENDTFLGVMFADVNESENKDAIGLFNVCNDGKNTDFFAFCSEYDYKSRYQNKNMITEYQKTQKLCDVFNAYNLNENAYAVSYITIVDFTDNPTQNANKTKYMHTVWNYTDVIPINSGISGFDSVVSLDTDSYTVSYSPENDREIVVDEDVSTNFFYGRYYTASYKTASEGIIKSLYKGFGDVKAGWSIALTKGKKKEENFVYSSVNLTGIADIISLSGHYTPTYSVVVYSKDYDGNKNELKFGFNVDAFSVKYVEDT